MLYKFCAYHGSHCPSSSEPFSWCPLYGTTRSVTTEPEPATCATGRSDLLRKWP